MSNEWRFGDGHFVKNREDLNEISNWQDQLLISIEILTTTRNSLHIVLFEGDWLNKIIHDENRRTTESFSFSTHEDYSTYFLSFIRWEMHQMDSEIRSNRMGKNGNLSQWKPAKVFLALSSMLTFEKKGTHILIISRRNFVQLRIRQIDFHHREKNGDSDDRCFKIKIAFMFVFLTLQIYVLLIDLTPFVIAKFKTWFDHHFRNVIFQSNIFSI